MEDEAFIIEQINDSIKGCVNSSVFPAYFTRGGFYPPPQPVTIKVYSKWESRWMSFKYWWNDMLDRIKL